LKWRKKAALIQLLCLWGGKKKEKTILRTKEERFRTNGKGDLIG